VSALRPGDGHASGGRGLLLYTACGVLLVVLWTALVFVAGNPGGGGDRAPEASWETTDERSPEPIGETMPGEKGELGSAVPEEGPPEETRSDPPEGGAANEPGGYDPLGLAGESGGPTETDRGRARLAAARFVAAAYGYSGRDRVGYLSAVNETVVLPGFYSSEGAEEVERYSEEVERAGARSAAKLTGFEVRSVTDEVVEGRAYFETGDAYDDHGNLEGERRAYRQELTLERRGAVFRVKAAGEVEEA
jgi:hypothetical protein